METVRTQRFGLVMLLSLATVLWLIAAPRTDLTRAVALLLQGGAFIVALVAARDHERLRRRTGVAVAVVILAGTFLAGQGVLSNDIRVLTSLVVATATPAVMIRGLVRLLRERGVVAQAVFGALALYLQLGLIFAFVASGIAAVETTPFFNGSDSADLNDYVYWSFTTMSTTGYGDFTPDTDAGRSLAVLIMLIGQIYLVTVVAMLIGNMQPRREQAN
jgi:hypothetical protein